MEIKDILLVLTPGEPNAARLATARRLADPHAARVVGACLYERPDFPLSDAYAVGYEADANVLDREDRRVAELLAPVAVAFGKTFSGCEATAHWEVPAADELPAVSAARARFVDLTVIGRDPREPRTPVSRIEALVLSGGSPCLLLPEDGHASSALRRVVVGWNGSRQAKRALDDSLVFLRQASSVEIVVVEEADRPVDDDDLVGILSRLGRHGVDATAKRLPPGRHAADGLRRHCRDSGADLLVIGAYSHSHAAEVMLGGVTRSMLREPSLAVFAAC